MESRGSSCGCASEFAADTTRYALSKSIHSDCFGRLLPVVIWVCVGQVECKRLVSWNVIVWSVVVQIGGQITAVSQLDAAPNWLALNLDS